MWVNTKTLLPTRIEGGGVVGKGIMTGFKEFKYQEVMHSIEYDVDMDKSIFQPNIPDDYTLIDPAAAAQKAEAALLLVVPGGYGVLSVKRRKAKRGRGVK